MCGICEANVIAIKLASLKQTYAFLIAQKETVEKVWSAENAGLVYSILMTIWEDTCDLKLEIQKIDPNWRSDD